MPHVLLATRDPVLHDELTRLAAAAGVSARDVADAGSALRAWSAAEVVLVGADLADALVDLGPPRRPRVFVVADGAAPDATFRSALLVGAEQVVLLPDGRTTLAGLLGDLEDERARPAPVVGVVGGSGGAGATTFACALGQVAARSGPAVVVDVDPLGPGADRVLGLDASAGARWDDLARTTGRMGARSFREALPSHDGLGVLTWSAGSSSRPAPATVRESLSAARRGHDLVVVDLPRCVDELVEETLLRCDLVVVVLRPSVSSLTATTRLVGRLADAPRLGLVVRGHGVDPADLAAVSGATVLAEMADQRRLDESVDLGLGPVRGRRGPLARAAGEVLAQAAR